MWALSPYVDVVDAESCNICPILRQRVHTLLRSIKVILRVPILHERFKEGFVHSIFPARSDGIAPSSLSEATLEIFSKSTVKLNSKRFLLHLLTQPSANCEPMKRAQNCRERKRKRSAAHIQTARCYHISSLSGNYKKCKVGAC